MLSFCLFVCFSSVGKAERGGDPVCYDWVCIFVLFVV